MRKFKELRAKLSLEAQDRSSVQAGIASMRLWTDGTIIILIEGTRVTLNEEVYDFSTRKAAEEAYVNFQEEWEHIYPRHKTWI